MESMANLNLVSDEQLLALLQDGIKLLSHAYEITQFIPFWHKAMEFMQASDGLLFTIQAREPQRVLH